MRNQIKHLLVIVSLILSIDAVQSAEPHFVSIGTSGVTSIYYPTGGAICRFVNKNRKKTGIRCSVESTGGSVFNITAIQEGGLEFGVAQSDWQYHAYNGTSKFKDAGAFKELRSVFSLYAEPFTVVKKSDFDKQCNVCANNTCRCEDSCKCTDSCCSDKSVTELAVGMTGYVGAYSKDNRISVRTDQFCNGNDKIWAIESGHPSGLTKHILDCVGQRAELVNIVAPNLDDLIRDKPYYRRAIIPAGMYNNDKDIKTLGLGATFISSAKVPEEVVYEVVKAVFENFDNFKKLHPAFTNLKKTEMVSASLSAPLHDGAIKYYKEAGLIE